MNGMGWRARIDKMDGNADAILGAGFLVSPCHLLTCAHVVDGLDGVLVAFPGVTDGDRLPATVKRLTGWCQQNDRGDVALLELTAPAPVGANPCHLAPLDAIKPRPGTAMYELHALGFPPNLDGNGDYVTLSSSSYRDLGNEWLQADVDDVHLQRLNEGFSGAGLYLPDSGVVAGMITDAVLEDERGGYIGRMMPLTTIRRYWEEIDDLLPLPWMEPGPRAELRAAVSGAALTADLDVVFAMAFPAVIRCEHLTTPWAAIRYTAESVMADQGLQTLLARLMPYLDDGAQSRLTQWMHRWAPEWAEEMGRAPAPVASIVITLATPTRNGKTHVKLTARTLVDGLPAAPPEERVARREQEHVQAQAEKLITSQVSQLRFPDFRLEFAVRRNEFGLPFDEWKYQEPGATRPRPVRSVPLIVRDATRMDSDAENIFLTDRIRKRWHVLRGGGTDRVSSVPCRSPYDYEQFFYLLEADQAIGALAYASSPCEDWIDAALDVGIPVMLWCRRDCAADDAEHALHETFLAEITAAVSSMDPDRLPAEVARLRTAAKSVGTGGEDHLGRHLTLFWDNPARLPDPPMGGS
jgi:hypothetical protein